MTVEVKIGADVAAEFAEPDEPLKIKVDVPAVHIIHLKMRRSINGDYMIYDHPLYDIVIMPKKNKVVTFIKRDTKIDPYPAQDRFFEYLRIKGVILPDSIQSGNVFGSLEAAYPINDKVDTIQALLLVMHNFLKDEAEDIDSALEYDSALEDYFTEPSREDSTELGEIPHAKKKGSIEPSSTPYGLIYRI